MSEPPAPAAASPFSLRWRLLGIRFCIMPSFWLMSALWGYLFAGPLGGRVLSTSQLLLTILLWVLCTLVSVLIHELGHVIMGRIFGQPGDITLQGLGGQAVGNYEYLHGWQRMLVAAAGPWAGFLFLGLQIALDFQHWNSAMDFFDWPSLKSNWCLMEKIDPVMMRDRRSVYYISMGFLFMMNLFWNLINLIPIIPLDGGMIFREICIMISKEGGLKFAYIWSIVLASAACLYHVALLLVDLRWISLPFPLPSIIFPILGIIMFGMMAFQCFAAFRQISSVQRQSKYADTFDD